MPAKKSGYKDLKIAFKHKNFEPLYFLYGTEGFLISELENVLIQEALEPHEKDFNLDIVYGAEADIDNIIGLCSSYPVMAQNRVVIIRDFEKVKDNDRFVAYTKNPNPTAIVVASCRTKPNLSHHPYRALKKNAVAVEFKDMKGRQLTSWVDNQIREQGLKADGQAVQMLVEIVGPDLRALAAEIEKLITYLGNRTQIKVDDVLLASGQTRDFNVFELQAAIGQAKYTRAVSIAERLLRQASNTRGEAIRIVAVLSAYLVKLWRLTNCQENSMREGDMAQQIGIPSYFLKEYIRSLRFFNPERIRVAFKLMLAADFELKGGSTRDPLLIVTLLLRGLIPRDLRVAA
ncbi:MAG: DNA polymerase III subunit delta [Rhodothermales bacterium]|nr:DNA polymerase III subunit delta [Rhodothermales bacterium]